ncbi:Ig-like domain-containing protein [Candidatus Palauibacter sp.]|uniref:Ig-like domain-containing protein n=1 Tax=Candidatus Palauibacter sp. TaxID=3101350 RepID=UPI003B52E24A
MSDRCLLLLAGALVWSGSLVECYVVNESEPDRQPESANRAPRPVGAIPPQSIGLAQPVTIDLSGYFSDPDGDRLSFGARANNAQVATVSVSGDRLTITGITPGTTAVTVTAEDPRGLTATQSVIVTVSPVG